MMVMHIIAELIALCAPYGKRIITVIAISFSALLLLWAEGELSWVWTGRIAMAAAALWLLLFTFDMIIDLFARMRRER
jgi:hypothetical protein